MSDTHINYEAYLQFAHQVEELPLNWSLDELTAIEQHQDDVLRLWEEGYEKGVSTGWRSMDDYFRVRLGEFTVITGIPGHGKSSWLDNVMINLSRRNQWRWAVFSAENYPIARHISQLTEIYSGKPFNLGVHERLSRNELQLCLNWLQRYFYFLRPAENSYSLNHIVQLASTVDNLSGLVIDPWNELDHSRPATMREDEHISVSLSKLRWLARSSRLHVFVIAHPAKYLRSKDEEKPVITLNDVKGASEWYAKADNGISVWRKETERDAPTEIHVQKIRFRDVGRVGKVDLYYDRTNGRFTDPRYPVTIEDLMERQSREPGEEG